MGRTGLRHGSSDFPIENLDTDRRVYYTHIMTTTPMSPSPFQGEIRITLDASSLDEARTLADRLSNTRSNWTHPTTFIHAIYLVDENGNEIEGA